VETVNPEAWASVKAHFDALLALPPQQRAAGLDAITDDEVRREVASLLNHSGEARTFAAIVGSMAAQVEFDSPAERIGPYRLVRRLGHGGQGTVYEAVRDDGSFEQRVAIKMVNWELDSEPARRRFREERQILAGLEHPSIARLLDGGETANGTPYLVMEFIDGLPLIEATEGWNTRQKLGLFLKIAGGVAEAHRKLIVHRDLKPGNILVTRDGEPKLLDFGIAKLLDPGSQNTQTAFQALTPAYASPEQVRGLPISTASDVYSLGVVLYQLLTGRKPYQMENTTPLELDRIICRQPPEPAGLDAELDPILAMALRKEPERRYPSVDHFAEDVRRYLEGRPVHARPDTVAYRTRKYMRRHWIGLVAASIALAGVFGGAAAALYQARIARQRFDQVRKLAHRFVFDYQDDLAKVAGTVAVRERMVSTALEYLDALAKSASNDLELQKELAAAYHRVGDAQGFPTKPNLGHTDQAVASYRKAAAIYEAVAARDPDYRAELGGFYTDFARLLDLTNDIAGADRMAETALALEQRRARERPDEEAAQVRLVNVWVILADLEEERGSYGPALAKNRSGEAIAHAILARWHNREAILTAQRAVERIGSDSLSAGHLTEALQAYDENEKLLSELRQLEPTHPGLQRAVAVLAQFRADVYDDDRQPSFEDPGKSLPYARQYLAFAQQMVKSDPNDAAARFSLAVALFRLSFPLKDFDPPGAVAAARESVQMFDQLASSGRSALIVSRRARALLRLAQALLAAGRSTEAWGTAQEALSALRKVAADSPRSLSEQSLLVGVLLTAADAAQAAGHPAAALPYLVEAERLSATLYAKLPAEASSLFFLARARDSLARYWRRAGDEPQAHRWQADSQALWRDFPDQNEFVRRKIAQFARAGGS
jgi:tRNA A-37 threonylcarbamoyl transferase component Bud32